MKASDYWIESVEVALDDNNVKATKEQVAAIAADIETSLENYWMVNPTPPNPLQAELDTVKRELKKEQDKVVCKVCHGTGQAILLMNCWKCHGRGWVDP